MTEGPPPPSGSFFRRARGERPAEPVGPSGLAAGRVIGDFRLERKLGEGGMGQVWQAIQISLRRPVALKLLPSERVLSEKQLALFEREARAGGRLHHPSIVAVLAFGEADGVPYIAQELIGDGWSLADTIREARDEGELPADWYRHMAEFFARAADALAVAHGAGVIHRDIKPSNILVAEDDRPVIADFGLASVAGVETISRSGDLAGTYAYMSPEQAMARRMGRLDDRTDVFSLGASLYEALTLRRAVEGDSHQQIAESVLYVDPPAPHVVRSRIDKDLSVIAMKALEKRRQDRYQSMADFAADLRRWLGNEPILARPAGPVKRARKWIVRHPTLSAVLSLSLVSAVVFAWLAAELSTQNLALEQGIEREKGLSQDLAVALDEAKTQRQLAEDNAASAQANAEQARAEKANVLRLSAFQELEDLRRDANALWPATLERMPAYDAWLARGDELRAGLQPAADGQDQGHRRQLETLRERALPRTDEQRQIERAAHPRAAELAEMDTQIAQAETAVASFRAGLGSAAPSEQDAAKLAAIEAKVAGARKARDALHAEVDERRVFTFADEQDTWWHNQLTKLIDEIEAFADPQAGLIDGTSETYGWGVKRRRDFAATVEERTVTDTDAQARWSEAVASIADRESCPAYDGLQLAPQLGLLPIGRDPESGLWEFWHVMSGDEPLRSADGKLAITDMSGIVLVLIPGGTFWMGAQNAPGAQNHDPQAQRNEGPVHAVTLSPYLLSKYEMTQGQWQRFTDRNPSNFGPDTLSTTWNRARKGWSALHPVEQVDWNQCMEVVNWLGLVLPTEAWWEYGCRAGTSTVYWSGNEKESLQGIANLADSYGKKNGYAQWTAWEDWLDDGQTMHAEVGSYRPNAFGLHDVHGNVWEWCRDGYDSDAYGQGPVQDPMVEPASARFRVSRGGCFNTTASLARSADRLGNSPDSRDFLGLRPAKGISP